MHAILLAVLTLWVTAVVAPWPGSKYSSSAQSRADPLSKKRSPTPSDGVWTDVAGMMSNGQLKQKLGPNKVMADYERQKEQDRLDALYGPYVPGVDSDGN